MDIRNKNEVIETLKKIYNKIRSGVLEKYWQGFKPFPIAFYDKNNVYIIGLSKTPEGFQKENDILIGKWNEKFIGNTAIKYEGDYIAIWDLTTLNDYTSYEKIYSNIVHEIFHGFQMINGDKRFANEFLFFQYPFNVENIALRLEERKYLLKSVFEEDKIENIKYFISYREKRRELIKEYLNYELGLESIEGTATYVEYKALLDESSLPDVFLLSIFGEDLNKAVDYNKFRQSCYSSGLYLSILLDYFKKGWKKEYSKSSMYLYDYFLENIDLIPSKEISLSFEIKKISEMIIKKYNEYTEKEFEEFYTSERQMKILKGKYTLAAFDPMNIIKKENFLLHKNFLKVKEKDNEIFIPGPAISEFENEIWNINKIIYFK